MVNSDAELALSPPEMLAIAYTPKVTRADFRWLLLLDHRLREVVERAREPMIAQLRLAWWRDVLGKTASERPKGEPLLAALGELGNGEALATVARNLVDAYEEEDNDRLRTSALFSGYAALLSEAADAGTVEKLALWATDGSGSMPRAPRSLRPLSILALAARLEKGEGRANGLRLSWHALTGR